MTPEELQAREEALAALCTQLARAKARGTEAVSVPVAALELICDEMCRLQELEEEWLNLCHQP